MNDLVIRMRTELEKLKGRRLQLQVELFVLKRYAPISEKLFVRESLDAVDERIEEILEELNV